MTLLKLKNVVLTEMDGGLRLVPVSCDVGAVPDPPLAESVADRAPNVPAVNTTAKTQLEPGLIGAPWHALGCTTKSNEPIEMLTLPDGPPPIFWIVKV